MSGGGVILVEMQVYAGTGARQKPILKGKVCFEGGAVTFGEM